MYIMCWSFSYLCEYDIHRIITVHLTLYMHMPREHGQNRQTSQGRGILSYIISASFFSIFTLFHLFSPKANLNRPLSTSTRSSSPNNGPIPPRPRTSLRPNAYKSFPQAIYLWPAGLGTPRQPQTLETYSHSQPLAQGFQTQTFKAREPIKATARTETQDTTPEKGGRS